MDISKLMFRNRLLEGERILVTGGGTGLGREMAEAFVSLGAEVHICGRRQGKLDETAQDLTDRHGGTIIGHACDIRDPEAIHAMVEAIWQHGPLTGVVNNAAGNFISRTEDLSVGGFNAISDIVFRGSFYVTLEVGKRLIAEQRRASFLSILTTWVHLLQHCASGTASLMRSIPRRPLTASRRRNGGSFGRMPAGSMRTTRPTRSATVGMLRVSSASGWVTRLLGASLNSFDHRGNWSLTGRGQSIACGVYLRRSTRWRAVACRQCGSWWHERS